MPITRTPIINDDLSGTTGTILDNAWKQELYGQIDALAAQQAAQAALVFSRNGRNTTTGVLNLDVVAMPGMSASAALQIMVQVTQLTGPCSYLTVSVAGTAYLAALGDVFGAGAGLLANSNNIWEVRIMMAGTNPNVLITQFSGSGLAGVGSAVGVTRVTATSVIPSVNWVTGGWSLGLETNNSAGSSQAWNWHAYRIG